jgi:hypothetical protein
MAEDELTAYSTSSKPCNISPFSEFTMPLYLAFRAGGRTWNMKSQEFGPGMQNSSFNFYLAPYLSQLNDDNP